MAARKTSAIITPETASAAKPDPARYNEVVAHATIRDIRLVGCRLDFKPEAVEAADGGWDFELTDQLDSWTCDNHREQLSGIHLFSASLVVRNKKVLSVQCRFLTSYRLSNLCDEEAGRAYLSRVGRLAAYPYFRSTFATLTQQSGITLPPLPVLSDGPRWVTAPQRDEKPAEAAPASPAAVIDAPRKRLRRPPV